MTREEAIKTLKEHKIMFQHDFGWDISTIKALDMAIKALEQQPCKDWHDVPSDEMTFEQARQAVKDLRKKLAEDLEKNLCGDLISRQAAIDIIESWLSCDDYNEAERNIMRAMQSVLYDLPSVKPQQPCEDCISRQEVNDGFKKYVSGSFAYGCVWDYINKLPSVTPKEKTEWIPVCERLPETHQDILLSLRSLDVEVGFRAASEPYFYCNGTYIEPQNVLAWMPLPKPYKEVSK